MKNKFYIKIVLFLKKNSFLKKEGGQLRILLMRKAQCSLRLHSMGVDVKETGCGR
jgi:hypothetical protein